MRITIPVSVGELLDKISILEIKRERITDEAKRHNVERELAELNAVAATLPPVPKGLRRALKTVNEKLWEVEDEVRRFYGQGLGERQDEFIRLAFAVPHLNRDRSDIKRQINEATGSEIVEEKQYAGMEEQEKFSEGE
jgi:hypothetical protein